MKTAMKNIITLTIITLVAGFCLGYIYDITKEPIARTAEATKQAAYTKVFPTAKSFEEQQIDETSAEKIISDSGIEGVSINGVALAQDDSGDQLGCVITTVSHNGYGGDIVISMGVDNEGTVLGVEILEISETAGLGMKADTDAFKNQFKDKNVSQFSYTKTGSTQDFEVDALSGATITTKAFVNAVNGGLVYFNSQGGAN